MRGRISETEHRLQALVHRFNAEVCTVQLTYDFDHDIGRYSRQPHCDIVLTWKPYPREDEEMRIHGMGSTLAAAMDDAERDIDERILKTVPSADSWAEQ